MGVATDLLRDRGDPEVAALIITEVIRRGSGRQETFAPMRWRQTRLPLGCAGTMAWRCCGGCWIWQVTLTLQVGQRSP
jgi:hypothetical protein